MSKLSVGIVGLPNVGKSTLFNALLKAQQAYAANFPFATIEPNIGVVPVPDARLEVLSSLYNSAPIVPANVEFVDIAGLVAGAHKGEGLGNKFLSHIRSVDAIAHVVRNFPDEEVVRAGSFSPELDLEVIQTELVLADLESMGKQAEKLKKNKDRNLQSIFEKLMTALNEGKPASSVEASDLEAPFMRDFHLLTQKPYLVVVNVSESDLSNASKIESEFAQKININPSSVVAICAKAEEQLAGFSSEEASEYLSTLGVSDAGLTRLIQKAYSTLGLISFLTAGEKEVRAWTIEKGTVASEAAGEIHADFVKKFIKADVCSFDTFVECGGWKVAREKGLVRQEGRDYTVAEGDVIEFKIGA